MFSIIKKHFNSKGFSLLEMIVALAIIFVAFLGLMQSFPFSLTINKTAENMSKATFLAQARIEQLRSLNYSDINIGVIETKHRLGDTSNDYLYFFQRETTVDYVDGDLADSITNQGIKKISINVYYTNSLSKDEKVYNLTTLINQW